MDKKVVSITRPAPGANQDQPLFSATRHHTIVNQCQAKIVGFKIRNISGLAPDDIIALAADLDMGGSYHGVQ